MTKPLHHHLELRGHIHVTLGRQSGIPPIKLWDQVVERELTCRPFAKCCVIALLDAIADVGGDLTAWSRKRKEAYEELLPHMIARYGDEDQDEDTNDISKEATW